MPSQSLGSRALQALLLTVGFYALAFGIAFALLWIVYAELFLLGRTFFVVTIPCIIGAWIILTSLLPRHRPFTAPGPRLHAKDYPQLFAELESVAKLTKQPVPKEVYLLPEVSAWVGERGGFLGLGRKRIMGLGLPLMELLTLSQFRAVVAHEFGHYCGGDTALGPWIYRTRSVIGQTIMGLAQRNSSLRKPFIWYGNYFLRVTHAISRQQELSADRLAATLIGAKPLGDGLRLVHQTAPAFQAYWSNDVCPALNVGLRPPLLEGFHRFLTVNNVAELLEKTLMTELNERKTDPYDTHPTLKERLAAIESLPLGDIPKNEARATSLLGNAEELELPLLAAIGSPQVRSLKTVRWEEVGDAVYPTVWQGRVKRHHATLKNFTLDELPRLCHDVTQLGAELFYEAQGKQPPTPEVARSYGLWVLGSAFALSLKHQGWHSDCLPGEEARLSLGEITLEPFKMVYQLFEGALKLDVWSAQCDEAGITNFRLS